MYQWTGNAPPPGYDQARADQLVGKYILIGITYFTHEKKLIEQVQVHGIVKAASRSGLRISLHGSRHGEEWNMPPDLRAISKAGPGEYRLRSTGEVVTNPDFLANWEITKPAEH